MLPQIRLLQHIAEFLFGRFQKSHITVLNLHYYCNIYFLWWTLGGAAQIPVLWPAATVAGRIVQPAQLSAPSSDSLNRRAALFKLLLPHPHPTAAYRQ